MLLIRLVTLSICFAGAAFPALAKGEDMAGSRDYADFPRVEGTHIAGYSYSEYDAGRFVARTDEKGRPVLSHPEGKRTRIIYLGRESQTPLQLLRNYQRAFADFGDYQEHYSCSGKDCAANLAPQIVWSEDNRIKTSFRNAYSLYIGFTHTKPMYAFGTVFRGEAVYQVSVFTSFLTGGQTGLFNVPIVHLEVVEMESFEPSLVFVSADEISTTIDELGAISLYGIQFEFDSAAITAESTPTLEEVAKALSASPALEVLVVGHTDNAGTLEYNQQLSRERAEAVVTVLVSDHGVSETRLAAIGIGPAAPKASNGSEEGRKRNRRVEIVKR